MDGLKSSSPLMELLRSSCLLVLVVLPKEMRVPRKSLCYHQPRTQSAVAIPRWMLWRSCGRQLWPQEQTLMVPGLEALQAVAAPLHPSSGWGLRRSPTSRRWLLDLGPTLQCMMRLHVALAQAGEILWPWLSWTRLASRIGMQTLGCRCESGSVLVPDDCTPGEWPGACCRSMHTQKVSLLLRAPTLGDVGAPP